MFSRLAWLSCCFHRSVLPVCAALNLTLGGCQSTVSLAGPRPNVALPAAPSVVPTLTHVAGASTAVDQAAGYGQQTQTLLDQALALDGPAPSSAPSPAPSPTPAPAK